MGAAGSKALWVDRIQGAFDTEQRGDVRASVGVDSDITSSYATIFWSGSSPSGLLATPSQVTFAGSSNARRSTN